MIRPLNMLEPNGLRRLIDFLKGGQADPLTPAGRGTDRLRLIVMAAGSSALVRGTGALATLVSIPITLDYLGHERFGMWATLSTFSLLLGFADLGIGNVAVTKVSQLAGRAEIPELRRFIGTASIMLTTLATLLIVLSIAAAPFVGWAEIFAVSSPLARSEARPAATIFLTMFALSLPFSIAYRVQAGLQQGWRANLVQGAGNIAALVGVIGGVVAGLSLPWLVLALVGTPLVFAVVNWLVFFTASRSDLRPRMADWDNGLVGEIARTGGQFLVLQICYGVVFQANNLIVAQILGASAVTTFTLPDRLFVLVGVVISLGLTPLWPAYGDAMARGDSGWLRIAFRNSVLYSVVVTSVVVVPLVLLAPWIILVWAGETAVPFALLVSLAVWKIVEAVSVAFAMLLNGTGRISIQVGSAVLIAASSILFRVALTERFGVAGAPLGLIAAYLLFGLGPLLYACRKVLAEAGDMKGRRCSLLGSALKPERFRVR